MPVRFGIRKIGNYARGDVGGGRKKNTHFGGKGKLSPNFPHNFKKIPPR